MSTKPKICFIAGADSIHSYRWIKYFAEAGHEIAWISLAPTIFDPIPGVRFFHIEGAGGLLGMIKAILKTRRIVADFQQDLVHVHYVGANAILGLYSGVSTIVATPWGSDVILNKHVFFKRFFAARILRRADLISCDAWHMRNEVMQFGVPAERINIINFGIDSQRFSPRAANVAIRQQYDLGPEPAVVSLRNFEPVYDIPTLLRAIPKVLEKHPQTRFMLVGRGSLEAELKALAQSLGITHAVRFVGFVPNLQLPDTLCSLDVYVSTSLSDAGIAASTAEAMACELPVVVTNSGENDRWIENGKNGYLVPVKQPDALAEKISLLLSDAALRRQLGAAGRLTVQERNDFNAEMAKMENLYQRVVAKVQRGLPAMRWIKRLLRDVQEFAERRFIGSALQSVLWRYRHLYKRGWAEGYLETVDHPHRQQLVEAVAAFDPVASVLEVGCASGANLIRLRERFPDAELIGLDINARAVQVGQKYFADRRDARVRFLNVQAEQIKTLEARSVDVVITDAVLMWVTPDRIRSVIAELARVARKGIVLNEYHGDGLDDGHFEGGRWVYDFVALLRKELPQAQIQSRKSSFVGGAWDVYGTLIDVHL